ncbi:MAG: class I SAM-dependent methyltransferase [Cyanobacteriota bacterium]
MSYITFRNLSTINKNHLDARYSTYFNSNTVIDKLSLAICDADFLSKKEYCESVEVLRQVQRFIKSNQNVNIYDICGGHGFVGILLALLSRGVKKSFIVDLKKPVAYEKIMKCASFVNENIVEKVEFLQQDYNDIDFEPNSIIIAIHACGTRSDSIINLAIKKNMAFVIMPCCYTKESLPYGLKRFTEVYDLKDFVDISRINTGFNSGYDVFIRKISSKVTPMNKIFIFLPENYYEPDEINQNSQTS